VSARHRPRLGIELPQPRTVEGRHGVMDVRPLPRPPKPFNQIPNDRFIDVERLAPVEKTGDAESEMCIPQCCIKDCRQHLGELGLVLAAGRGALLWLAGQPPHEVVGYQLRGSIEVSCREVLEEAQGTFLLSASLTVRPSFRAAYR
jgi:hypothetical protein